MPKGANQKLKLYYLSRILLEKTDDDHSLTMSEIRSYLEVIGSIPKVKDGQHDEFLQEKGEKIKQSAADVSKDVIGSFAEVSDPNTGLFVEKMNDMVSIYNKTTEICFDKDNIYLIA